MSWYCFTIINVYENCNRKLNENKPIATSEQTLFKYSMKKHVGL